MPKETLQLEDQSAVKTEECTDALLGSDISTPAVIDEKKVPEKMKKTYQINTENLEAFLEEPSTDDLYYEGINKTQPIGCSNGLAYVDDGYGAVLKIQFVRK